MGGTTQLLHNSKLFGLTAVSVRDDIASFEASGVTDCLVNDSIEGSYYMLAALELLVRLSYANESILMIPESV